jgi:hypothetical protein
MIPIPIKLTAAAVFALTAALAWAKATPDEIAKLGHDMTPVGAEKAGNKDNTIPAWDGGLTKARIRSRERSRFSRSRAPMRSSTKTSCPSGSSRC